MFSNNLISTLKEAVNICQAENKAEITPEHIFRALIKTKGSLAYDILSQVSTIKEPKTKATKTRQEVQPEFNSDSVKLLERAGTLAFKYQHSYIGTEHLLAALMELSTEQLKKYIAKGLPVEKIKTHLTTVLNSSSHIPNFSRIFQSHADKLFRQTNRNESTLGNFTIDLTEAVRQQDINPVIGRETELNQLIRTLCRKDKNNPLILGEAGVGKTALVEGLAKKISEKNVPPSLLNKKILNLDLGLLVAGTMYRGDFENRIRQLVEEVSENPNIILFIDEIHNLVGAGSANGTMDAANLLKPLLARGKLRCIGATTPSEFKKYIEADPALERRFQPIHLSAPSEPEALTILHGIKNNYEKYHGVNFSDEALEQAVKLSARYIQDKLLPDKAIDLMDEAASMIKLKYQSENKLWAKEKGLEEQLEKINEAKENSVLQEDFNAAIKYKAEQKRISEDLKNIKAELSNMAACIEVTKSDIIEVIARKTGIPVQDLTEQEYKKIAGIRKKLKEEILGQDKQIDEALRIISKVQLGLVDENRPLASFLFIGPSGVGKTLLARKLAKEFFSEDAFIQLDMSEFHETFQASKLIGAPAGYIGYREGNKFTDLVKKNPYCVILLDEIEKAHADVLNLFLQILEYGHLTDSTGRKVNFKNAIIIMTSNALADKLTKKSIGFGTSENNNNQEIKSELRQTFKPEFINRIGNVILFNRLQEESLEKILRQELNIWNSRLSQKGFSIKFENSVIEFLMKETANEQGGARAIKNIVANNIENIILDEILKGKKKNLKVQVNKNKITVK